MFLNTLRSRNRLQASGMSEEQATRVVAKLTDIVDEELAAGVDMQGIIAAIADRAEEIAEAAGIAGTESTG